MGEADSRRLSHGGDTGGDLNNQPKPMKLFSSALAAVAVGLIAAPLPSLADRVCIFNGVSEACNVTIDGSTYSARWLSDGKLVDYTVSGSSASIVEDNGRRSGGSASYQNGNLIVFSSNGNRTSIPLPPSQAPASRPTKGAAGAAAINGNGNVIIQQIYQSK